MSTVGSSEARAHLPELLARVASGEKITITKHGAPIAMLVPAAARHKPDLEAVIREIRRFRAQHELRGVSIRDLIEEGRRY